LKVIITLLLGCTATLGPGRAGGGDFAGATCACRSSALSLAGLTINDGRGSFADAAASLAA
jgi:hypothetical protein